MDERLLVGGAGSLTVPDTGGHPRYVSPAWRDIALARCEQLEICRAETSADWTYLSHPRCFRPVSAPASTGSATTSFSST